MFRTTALSARRTFLLLAALGLALGSFLLIPNGYERVAWRLQQMFAKMRRTIYAQPDVLPTPAIVSLLAPSALTPAATAADPSGALLATATPAHLPNQVELTGFTQIWQKVNNCGPATLAIGLTYWGWKGTQANTAAALKPDPNDRNVSPNELAAYARSVGLGAEVRVGGTLTRLKQLVAAGIPVIVEKGIVLPDAGWEGHYALITGYSDAQSKFTTQDSLQGPNLLVPYDFLVDNWRAFNYTYLALYPPARQLEVMALLGDDADPASNYAHAADLARQEIPTLSGQALAFAWFNLGTDLTALGNMSSAASAYDQARLAQLPWRMLWYQTGPFEAYYAASRYPDVITLAEATLAQAENLEEAYYWRGRARLVQGDREGAVIDWRMALHYNRNYSAPRQALADLGATP